MNLAFAVRGFLTIASIFLCIEGWSASLDSSIASAEPTDAHPHWRSVRIEPSPGRPGVRTRDKFNPIWWFKNSDDPLPPESYRPNDKHRLTKWRFRNPLHNFTFYVIGVADKKVVRSGLCPESNSNPIGGWNVTATRSKWLYLPFISWCHGQNGFHFYCGWRSRGNFGFKCNSE